MGVDVIKTVNLAMAHIVVKNPIINDNNETKKEYLDRLSHYLTIGNWNKRKYEMSGMQAYRQIILNSSDIKQEKPIEFYKYYILLDLIHILGYEIKNISSDKIKNLKKQYLLDFKEAHGDIFQKIINLTQGNEKRITYLLKNEQLKNEKEYIKLIRKNIIFRNTKPLKIMVTATMSAGKSTFINSLIGKYVCLSQNMACTSKIHSIINKSFEDGYSSEYDYDLVMTAGKEELLNDNEENETNMIYVATNYRGSLSNFRIIVNDSPGVNFSGNNEHKELSENLIKRKKYDLLMYVMNATQLGTNDDDEHLNYVKQSIGRKPIIFIMNKMDAFDLDEENVSDIINKQITYLKAKGFKNPVVCPMSARAGYLAKISSQKELLRSERRELNNYIDKFEIMKLEEYYKKNFPKIFIKDSLNEEEQLLKTCGLLYVEQIIKTYFKGGK